MLSGGPGALFFPPVKKRKFWKFYRHALPVPVLRADGEATVCLDCGSLWSKVDLAEVRKMIEKHSAEIDRGEYESSA